MDLPQVRQHLLRSVKSMPTMLAKIIRKKLPVWNTRILGYGDMPELCRMAKCGFIEVPAKFRGEYKIIGETPIIVIRDDLKNELRSWVALHELGHHLLHYPASHTFSRGVYCKADFQANFFAAVALMPTLMCREMTAAEIIAHYDYPKEIVEIRLRISYHFGL